MEKFCSFGFAEGLALSVGAKPNVQNVGWQKKFIFFFRAVGCFNFFRRVGLSVGKWDRSCVELQRNCLPILGRPKVGL